MKLFITALILMMGISPECPADNPENGKVYTLPAPSLKGTMSVEEALQQRRSRRQFMDRELSMEQLSQILWSAYGITAKRDGTPALKGGLRTAPSAGALYPLEIYVLVGNVKGIEPGLYKYNSKDHSICCTISGDLRNEAGSAAYNQKMIKEAPAILIYSDAYDKSSKKYGARGKERYVFMDLGHSAENVYLQAEALHLGTCAVGAFSDEALKKLFQLPADEEPIYMMPFGYCK